MAFYSINESANIQVDEVDSSLDTVEESTFDDYTEAALYNIAVSESNMNALFQRMGMLECSYYVEHNEELVYSEGTFSDIIDKLKAIVLKVWDKIKEVFKRFRTVMDRFFMEDKAFAKKYQQEIRKKTPKDLTYNGFKFTLEEPKASVSTIETKIENFLTKYNPNSDTGLNECIKAKEDVEDVIENLRSSAVEGCTTQKEMQKELFSLLRNGDSSKSKHDLTSNVINDALEQLLTGEKTRKKWSDDFKKVEKVIKKQIDNYNKLEKKINTGWSKADRPGPTGGKLGTDEKSYGDEIGGGDGPTANHTSIASISHTRTNDNSTTDTTRSEGITACMVYGKLVNAKLSILQLLNGCRLTASKDYSRQCKAICARMVHYNESANVWNHTESASVDDLFGNVKFN